MAAAVTGPFFRRAIGRLRGDERFCFFHAASTGTRDAPIAPRGSVLAVHAFAEEMNKTRAVAGDAARALAAAGFAVLQIDLAGCGDSAGEFQDATWQGWLSDLADAWSWLATHGPAPRWVWGTRLGGLLGDQFAGACVPRADGLLLWQPVVNGAQHLGQFLRLKTVNGMLRDAAQADAATTPVARVAQPSPRADLAAGRAIEVAGYRLTPDLADAIEASRLGSGDRRDAAVPPRIRWMEVSSQATPALTPIAAKVADRWREAGSDVKVVHVVGNAFWQTQEIERCDALVDATVESLAT